jgi:hypothetical protein
VAEKRRVCREAGKDSTMAFIASLKPKSRHLAAAAEDAAQIHQKFNARKDKMNQTLLRKNCIYKPNAERCTRAEKNPKFSTYYMLQLGLWIHVILGNSAVS